MTAIISGTRSQLAAVSAYAMSTADIYSSRPQTLYTLCMVDLYRQLAFKWGKYEHHNIKKARRRINALEIILLRELYSLASAFQCLYETTILCKFISQINRQLL